MDFFIFRRGVGNLFPIGIDQSVISNGIGVPRFYPKKENRFFET
jgi:hypothetical protein